MPLSPLRAVISETDNAPQSYPETNQLSLEEIDYLFAKNEVVVPSNGMRKLLRPTQPVLESLKPRAEIEADIENDGGLAEATMARNGGLDVEKESSQGDEKIEGS